MTVQLSFANDLIHLKRCEDVASKLSLHIVIDNTGFTTRLCELTFLSFLTSCHEVTGATLPPCIGFLSYLMDQPPVNISQVNSTVKLPAFSLVHAAACLVPPPHEVWPSKSSGSAQTPNATLQHYCNLLTKGFGFISDHSRNRNNLLSVSFLNPRQCVIFRDF